MFICVGHHVLLKVAKRIDITCHLLSELYHILTVIYFGLVHTDTCDKREDEFTEISDKYLKCLFYILKIIRF